jgi:putative transposase
MNLIRDIWLAYPFYGYRKITIILRRDYKKEINKKRVLRLMQEAGIQAIYPKPKLSMGNKAHKVYPYLLKDMRITKPNQVWMVDITYLKLNGRFIYLVALIDVYSRYIVGWNLSFDLDTANCLNALEMALKQGKADIVNSDQGTQFTSGDWIDALNDYGIQISMDGKGRCIDNIYIERFWRTIKYEAIFLNDYEDYKALYDGVKNYIKFYLEERPHQALNYRTPKELYFEVKKEKVLA